MRDAASELLHIMNFMNFTVERLLSRAWASATFSGARHDLTLLFQGEDAEGQAAAFLDGMEERDFPMRGHVLADIALVSRAGGEGAVRLNLEALTVEAA